MARIAQQAVAMATIPFERPHGNHDIGMQLWSKDGRALGESVVLTLVLIV